MAEDNDPRPVPSGWRCSECFCGAYAHVVERKPDGAFRPGPFIRCVECKSVFDTRSPMTSPVVSDHTTASTPRGGDETLGASFGPGSHPTDQAASHLGGDAVSIPSRETADLVRRACDLHQQWLSGLHDSLKYRSGMFAPEVRIVDAELLLDLATALDRLSRDPAPAAVIEQDPCTCKIGDCVRHYRRCLMEENQVSRKQATPEAPPSLSLDPITAARAVLEENDLAYQVADQCRVVAHLATGLARVHADYARMASVPAFRSILQDVGERSARFMEELGEALNSMDASSPDDAWTDPIFEKAQQLFPCRDALSTIQSHQEKTGEVSRG